MAAALQAPLPDGGSNDNLTDLSQAAPFAPALATPPASAAPLPLSLPVALQAAGMGQQGSGGTAVLPVVPAVLPAESALGQADAAPPPLAGHVPPPEPLPLPLSSGECVRSCYFVILFQELCTRL